MRKEIALYVLASLLALSLISQLFVLSLRTFRIQSEIVEQSGQIQEIQNSVDRISDKLQANDIIFEE